MKLIEYGSDYNRYVLPESSLDKDSICYLVGVGEDITFDCEIVDKYQCKGILFDPTPRSVAHFENVLQDPGISPIPADKNYPDYSRFSQSLHLLQYVNAGIAGSDEIVQFYPPSSPGAVSHSIDNIKNTSAAGGFKAQCYKLSTVMKDLGHEKIDLLKLNIEGAEIYIVNDIIKDQLPVKMIAVDFDYVKKYEYPPVSHLVDQLASIGYRVVYEGHNYTFIKDLP